MQETFSSLVHPLPLLFPPPPARAPDPEPRARQHRAVCRARRRVSAAVRAPSGKHLSAAEPASGLGGEAGASLGGLGSRAEGHGEAAAFCGAFHHRGLREPEPSAPRASATRSKGRA